MIRMRHPWLHCLIVMLVALMLLSGTGLNVAAAQTVSGTGMLEASGYGTVTLSGSGTVTIQEGAGVIWAQGADSIEAPGRGRRAELPHGAVRLTGYSGRVKIQGEDMTIRIAGGLINLTASGSGSAWLRGEGTYTTNNSSGTWTPRGIRVTF